MKVWKTTYADKVFSLFIRKRDGMCMRCHRRDVGLDCSHYWVRNNSGTRFDPMNCIALCRECHTIWEKRRNNEYKQFMLDWLGKKDYDLLETRARSFKSRDVAVAEFKAFYENEPSARAVIT